MGAPPAVPLKPLQDFGMWMFGMKDEGNKGGLCANPRAAPTSFKTKSKSHPKASLTRWEQELESQPLLQGLQHKFHLFLLKVELISGQEISLRPLPCFNPCKASVAHSSNH